MRFDERRPGLLHVKGGVVIADFLRCLLQDAKARGTFSVRRLHGAPAPRPLIVAVLLLIISGVHAAHASDFQQAWLLGGSGVRPGVVHSSPAAQGIVRPYCSTCRDGSLRGGIYWWCGTPPPCQI